MSTTLEQLEALLQDEEGEHLEFKEAKERYTLRAARRRLGGFPAQPRTERRMLVEVYAIPTQSVRNSTRETAGYPAASAVLELRRGLRSPRFGTNPGLRAAGGTASGPNRTVGAQPET